VGSGIIFWFVKFSRAYWRSKNAKFMVKNFVHRRLGICWTSTATGFRSLDRSAPLTERCTSPSALPIVVLIAVRMLVSAGTRCRCRCSANSFRVSALLALGRIHHRARLSSPILQRGQTNRHAIPTCSCVNRQWLPVFS